MKCADVTASLLRLCCEMNIKVLIENPTSSGLWEYPPIRTALARLQCVDAHVDMCAYGAPFRKPTLLRRARTSRRCCRLYPHADA
eukprot:2014100-Heterocapsa_arctica.AAC.1